MPVHTVIYTVQIKQRRNLERRRPELITSSGARGFSVLAPVRKDEIDHVKHDRHIDD
jgi:hypothetical protein